ncbi:MAG: class II aldolase/adducin family protein [Intrasporangium sp.]|uniref:class II aldolase/adducin family protein n=1 Tax=Intrasporangium sp. TaxID=1925024 RepID=UPI003F7E585A
MEELRRDVALACRILGATGLTTPLLGHVSVRVDDDHVLVRCRGPHERGLLFTTTGDIRLVSLTTSVVCDGYELPNEFPIHREILRARPDVDGVLHAHPRSALLAGLADVPTRPVFGAFDIPAYRLAASGVPLHPDAGLIHSVEAGQALAATMGEAAVCLLRGHGIVTAAGDVPTVVAHALALDELLTVSVELARLGVAPPDVPPTGLPDLGPSFNVDALWRHHVGLLELRGLAEVG